MKKALSILLSLILLFGLTACGSATMDSVAADTPSMAPSTNGALKEEMGFDGATEEYMLETYTLNSENHY